MVGRSWTGLLTAHGIPFDAASRPEIDLQRHDSLAHAIRPEHDLVVNAAAWTDVDSAETEEPSAINANGEAVRAIASRCKELQATLIHYSTDYVFAGDGKNPYPIDSPIAPVNAYGRSKARGEAALHESGSDHILIRTSWVYAPWGKNFVRTIAALAANRDSLRVVNDQRGRPTSAEHLASTSLAMYLAGAQGTWHATDGGECTWHELATEIVRLLNFPCDVQPCTSDEYPRPATRPAYSVLDLTKTDVLVGPRTDWQDAVHRVIERLER